MTHQTCLETGTGSSPVEAQVPLAHQVGGVPGLAEPLGQRVHVWRQTAGLAGPDDGVLEARVDLIPAEEDEGGGGGSSGRSV